MKKAYVSTICCLLCLHCVGAYATVVEYSLTDLGGSQFEYEYAITNDSLGGPIEQFTIWFDVDLCDNLTITTQEPLASQWNEIILEKTGFGLPIGYDALSLTDGIQQGQTESGFSVAFDWLGAEVPGPQFFEIINPITLETIDSGYTIPEPATLLLVSFGMLALRRKQASRKASKSCILKVLQRLVL